VNNRIEVANALPQPSHDQSCSMRPWALKRDSSATSITLPQRGHFGRLRFSVAKVFLGDKARVDTRGDDAWHADWTIIVDPPRRPPTATLSSRMLRAVCGVTATAQ